MRVAVVLHERLGGWHRQLRPRLRGMPVRLLESRSPADLEWILRELAFPIVLIDMARHPAHGLAALELVSSRAPGARTLVLDPQARDEFRGIARELGATEVRSGFTPPPVVADLLTRWIEAARLRTGSAGWSRTTFPEAAGEPWDWLSDYLDDPPATADGPMPPVPPSRHETSTRSSPD